MFTGGNNVEKLGFKSLLIDVFFHIVTLYFKIESQCF